MTTAVFGSMLLAASLSVAEKSQAQRIGEFGDSPRMLPVCEAMEVVLAEYNARRAKIPNTAHARLGLARYGASGRGSRPRRAPNSRRPFSSTRSAR